MSTGPFAPPERLAKVQELASALAERPIMAGDDVLYELYDLYKKQHGLSDGDCLHALALARIPKRAKAGYCDHRDHLNAITGTDQEERDIQAWEARQKKGAR